MAGLQYVNVPGYSALIFRKTLTDFTLSSESIHPTLEAWLEGTPAKFNGQEHAWEFPTKGRPARLQYGYIGADYKIGGTKGRYKGGAFQCILWDELTEHDENDYGFMFSRLVRPNCDEHRPGGVGEWNSDCDLCQEVQREFGELSRVPLRVRAASNPGGIGNRWVKKHFRLKMLGNDLKTGKQKWIGDNPAAPFIQAFVEDNKAVDSTAYQESLKRIVDPTTRRQLTKGDWTETDQTRFKLSQFPRYRIEVIAGSEHFVCGSQRVAMSRCRWFATVDVAASSREGPAEAQIYVRQEPSWSVVSVWAVTPQSDLVLFKVYRRQCEVPEVAGMMKQSYVEHPKLEFIAQEVDGLGIGLYQYAVRTGLPMRPVKSESLDKVVRSTDAQIRAENGKIWLPEHAAWLEEWEAEVESWIGDKRQQADQIDTMSTAARIVSRESLDGGLFDKAGESILDVVR